MAARVIDKESGIAMPDDLPYTVKVYVFREFI